MKNPFIVFILAFCALFAACQSAKNEVQPSQLVKTLKRSYFVVNMHNRILFNELQNDADIKSKIVPLYELSKNLSIKADLLSEELHAITNMSNRSTFDYPALFQKYTNFCQLVKDSLYTLKSPYVANTLIKRDKLDAFFAQSPLGAKAQKPLSKAEFAQLQGEDLQIYKLTLQLDLLTGVNDIILFLTTLISSDYPKGAISYQIFSYPDKPAIFLGEEYVAEVTLEPYYKELTNLDVKIDNDSLAITNGKATYRRRPKKIGSQSYDIKAIYTNPETNEVVKISRRFFYDVLPPQANKPN